MVSSKLLFLSSIFILTAQSVARPDLLYHFCMHNQGNYTGNSIYEENLNHLLSSLSSNTENIDYGFYNSSYGQSSDKVYADGLCRGDVNPDVCHSCLNNAASLLNERCLNQMEAIGGDDYCMLRYSNRSIFGVMETYPSFSMWNPNNVSANYVDQFKYDLRTLLESLSSQAAAGGPLKFASGSAKAPNFQTLYGLVQCTPDLSEQQWNDCLLGAFETIHAKEGGRVARPSCNIRFEVYPFYDPTTAASPLPSPSPSPGQVPRDDFPPAAKPSGGRPLIVIIIPVLTIASLLLIIFVGGIVRSVKNLRPKVETPKPIEQEALRSPTIVGTENLSESNKQAQGGPGAVSEDKPDRNAANKSKLKIWNPETWKKPNILTLLRPSRKKKDGSPINEENDNRGLLQPMPSVFTSSSSSSHSTQVSQLTRELDEYKRKLAEAQRELNRQHMIEMSSMHGEMQQQIQLRTYPPR